MSFHLESPTGSSSSSDSAGLPPEEEDASTELIYYLALLDGVPHYGLADTGSNINIISYLEVLQRVGTRANDTNSHVEILGTIQHRGT